MGSLSEILFLEIFDEFIRSCIVLDKGLRVRLLVKHTHVRIFSLHLQLRNFGVLCVIFGGHSDALLFLLRGSWTVVAAVFLAKEFNAVPLLNLLDRHLSVAESATFLRCRRYFELLHLGELLGGAIDLHLGRPQARFSWTEFLFLLLVLMFATGMSGWVPLWDSGEHSLRLFLLLSILLKCFLGVTFLQGWEGHGLREHGVFTVLSRHKEGLFVNS